MKGTGILPLADIATRYLKGNEPMSKLAQEHEVSITALYHALVAGGHMNPHPKRQPVVSAMGRDEFVRVWNSSATVDEFLDKTGISSGTAKCRAARYRKTGVELKMLRWKPWRQVGITDSGERALVRCCENPRCGKTFQTNDRRAKYCGVSCRTSALNARNYRRRMGQLESG